MVIPNIKNALHRLYDGTCCVYTQVKVKDPVTKVTRTEDKQVYTDLPCHLSVDSAQEASAQENGASSAPKRVTLFCDPELAIPSGSRITVTQCGRTDKYRSSGIPDVYAGQQEITLVPAEDWT